MCHAIQTTKSQRAQLKPYNMKTPQATATSRTNAMSANSTGFVLTSAKCSTPSTGCSKPLKNAAPLPTMKSQEMIVIESGRLFMGIRSQLLGYSVEAPVHRGG